MDHLGGLILAYAPLFAVWGLLELVGSRRWSTLAASVAALGITIGLGIFLHRYSWPLEDADRRVAVGGIPLIWVFFFLLMTLFAVGHAGTEGRSGYKVGQRSASLQGFFLVLLGLCSIAYGANQGSEQNGGYAEALLINGGTILLLGGVYRGLLTRFLL